MASGRSISWPFAKISMNSLNQQRQPTVHAAPRSIHSDLRIKEKGDLRSRSLLLRSFPCTVDAIRSHFIKKRSSKSRIFFTTDDHG
jgi:hypothetical protein